MILKIVLKNSLLLAFFILNACQSDNLPKPKAYLRLDYPEAQYVKTKLQLPFSFEVNKIASKIDKKHLKSTTQSYGVTIEYPSLKGTLFLTYKALDNNQNHLISLLRDAQNFTQKHMIKADEIPVTVFENRSRQVFGSFIDVKGDVASNAQFFLTDSLRHFLVGSLYFNAKPNYDSILPAVHYLQKDIRHLMETLQWE